MYSGSRKHVLDWTGRETFLAELGELVAPAPVRIASESVFMPRGHDHPDEARLATFGREWLSSHEAWCRIDDWWLVNKAGANTPSWDIAVGCMIEDRPGLVLVEAMASHPELGAGGKLLRLDSSKASRENHNRIGAAIDEACDGWNRLGSGTAITRDSHYQLANRLALTWKLAKHGIPVVLLYLGFTGDTGIDAGKPFLDDEDWQRSFAAHASATIPMGLFGKRLEIDATPVWLMLRSRPVNVVSPARSAA